MSDSLGLRLCPYRCLLRYLPACHQLYRLFLSISVPRISQLDNFYRWNLQPTCATLQLSESMSEHARIDSQSWFPDNSRRCSCVCNVLRRGLSTEIRTAIKTKFQRNIWCGCPKRQVGGDEARVPCWTPESFVWCTPPTAPAPSIQFGIQRATPCINTQTYRYIHTLSWNPEQNKTD